MATTAIKMSKRLALRLLNNQDCEVLMNPDFGFSPSRIYTTKAKNGIDDDIIYLKDTKTYTDIKNIKSIEYTDRFGNSHFMEVNWN